MRKRIVLALLLVVVLIVTASCKLIVKDAEVDKQTVIAEVAGQQIVKQDVEAEVNNVMNQMAYQYYMYGLNYDTTDPEHIATARSTAVDNMIKNILIQNKQQEMGLALTDEELAALQTENDEAYAGYIESYRTSYFADSELTGEDLDAAVLQMVEMTYGPKDQLLETRKTNALNQKLMDTVVADVTVTDDEIQTEYDNGVGRAMQSYATDPNYYLSDVSYGNTIYYVPEGFRYVKNLLVNLEEADSTAITELNAKLNEASTQLTSNNTALAALPEDAATDTEEQATNRADLTAQIAELEKQVADDTAKLAELQEAAYAKIQPTIDEVLAKLTAGESFDALVEQYGQDPGMKASPAKEQGYLVCEGNTTYVTEFTDAAMALAKVGDVSPAVRTSYGLHLIQYASDLASGPVPLETLKPTIEEALLTSKRNTEYNATLETWVRESGAKIYLDRMN